MEVSDIGEETGSIHEMLVEVVEIGKKNLTPRPETIQGLRVFNMASIGRMKTADGLDRVGKRHRRGLLEELADGQIVGSPDGGGRLLSQSLVEEQAGTLARKHDCDVTEVGTEALKQRSGNVFEKGFHRPLEIKG